MTTAGAAVVVYTDKASWEIAFGGQFLVEEFADAQLPGGVSVVSTESGHINPAQEIYQDVLASQSQNEPMATWNFTPEITGFGGNWTLGGAGGSGNSLLVWIEDFLVGSIPDSYSGGFWGFTSESPFASVRLVGGSGTNQQNYSLDDMVYSPVPLPAAGLFSTALVGLLGLGRHKPAWRERCQNHCPPSIVTRNSRASRLASAAPIGLAPQAH